MRIKYPILLSFIYLLTSCVSEDVVTTPINVSFQPSSELFSVASGQNFELGTNITQFSESFATTVWSSSDSSIIEVDNNGVINAIQSGEAEITVDVISSDNSILATQNQEIRVGNFTITEDEVKDLSEEEKNLAFQEGKVLQFSRTVSTLNVDDSSQAVELVFTDFGLENNNVIFNVESSDTSILEIGDNNELNPLAVGSVQITATASSLDQENLISVSKTINVTEEATEEIEVVVDDNIIGSGDFQSNSSYTVSGSFEIVEEPGRVLIELDEDFSARGVPDLVLYLSNSSTSNAGATVIAEVSSLRGSDFPKFNTSGAQTLVVPSGVNVENYSTVLLYCRRFGVRVGFGTIVR